MDKSISRKSILEERKEIKKKAVKKIRILLIIALALLALLVIILLAAIKGVGIQNIFKGDSNIFINTVKNAGTTFTGNDTELTTTQTPIRSVVLPSMPENIKDYTKEQLQNTIAFTSMFSDYELTAKKDSYILFINDTGVPISISCTNGLGFSLLDGDSRNYQVTKLGNFTCKDILDKTVASIKVKLEVVE